ncbi:hypothetical protein HUJ05_003792 [Dendroctonus ponderosae]|nr:hypothetical protein HUJ05_003792 [Dendroctonus ponderosae]
MWYNWMQDEIRLRYAHFPDDDSSSDSEFSAKWHQRWKVYPEDRYLRMPVASITPPLLNMYNHWAFGKQPQQENFNFHTT